MKCFTIVLVLFSFQFANGQDTLEFGYNVKWPVQVLKLMPHKVRYKNWDDLSGPWFTQKLKNVVLIKFHDGHIYTGDNAYDSTYAQKLKQQRITSTPVQPQANIEATSPKVKDSLFRQSLYALPDTLFTTHDTALPVRVLNAGKNWVIYVPWSKVMGPEMYVATDSVIKIKYQDGQLDYKTDIIKPDYWRQKFGFVHARQAAKADYYTDLHNSDVLFKKGSQWYHAGTPVIITGTLISIAGGIMLGIVRIDALLPSPNDPAERAQDKRLLTGGSALLSFGVAEFAFGIAALVISGKYFKKSYWIERKMVALSYPEPKITLPTAQNNYQKGFGLNAGISF